MKLSDFRNAGPRLCLEEYFTGKTTAWGLFADRFGAVRRQFVVDISGVWSPADNRLTLTEDFRYSDGETERRVWVLHKTGADSYTGTTADVIGQAEGRTAGNAFHWTYTMQLGIGERTWKVTFDDWMFLQPGGVLLNRASVGKWGLELGTVSIAFRKEETERNGAAATERRSAAE